MREFRTYGSVGEALGNRRFYPENIYHPWGNLGEDQLGIYTDYQVKGVEFRMRWIWPGTFMMGSPDDESERSNNEAHHEVTLTRGFWLADTACTQALWQAVMKDNPSKFKGEEHPVERIPWKDCQTFLEQINLFLPGFNLGLPTEAQWEYACRAGTRTPFSFGRTISTEQANFKGNYPYAGGKKGEYRKTTVPVKALSCNDWGLYQMHGNVYEWCRDWYGDYDLGHLLDPEGPDTGEGRLLRGGSWNEQRQKPAVCLSGHGLAFWPVQRHWLPPGPSSVPAGRRQMTRAPSGPYALIKVRQKGNGRRYVSRAGGYRY